MSGRLWFCPRKMCQTSDSFRSCSKNDCPQRALSWSPAFPGLCPPQHTHPKSSRSSLTVPTLKSQHPIGPRPHSVFSVFSVLFFWKFHLKFSQVSLSLFFFFLGRPKAYGAPGPGIRSELSLRPKPQLQQRRIPNPLCRARIEPVSRCSQEAANLLRHRRNSSGLIF